MINWKKYLLVFLFTTSIFLVVAYVSNVFSDRKIAELKSIQDKVAIDILSSETQFSLLSEVSCKNITGSFLAEELDELGGKLSWGEENLGKTEEMVSLRKYYSLLQIKDYLLMKRISERCGNQYAFVLYFYTTLDNCLDCRKASLALSSLRDDYPNLRVYSFDFNTDLSAIKTMIDIYKIEDTKLPAMVLGDDVLVGYIPTEELEIKIKEAFGLEPIEATETLPEAPRTN